MANWFPDHPGRLFLIGTLLPLAVVALLLFFGLVRFWSRSLAKTSSLAALGYRLCGGDRPARFGAYLSVLAIGASAVLCVSGLFQFLGEQEKQELSAKAFETRWGENIDWVRLGAGDDERPAMALQLGYRIDSLTALLMSMVSVISTCIFVFSLGYMKDETNKVVEDHDAHVKREGRFQRFYLYLSLFCFSMMNLLIADNLFQVFISWELVGVCSFFLIGFYYERHSASTAANKAFIMNRIGDAGFLVGLCIVWAYFGTFNFQQIFAQLRTPDRDTHRASAPVDMVNNILRGDRIPDNLDQVKLDPNGSQALLFPQHWHHQDLRAGKVDSPLKDFDAYEHYTLIPYTLLVIAGFGIFLGCVGKSAQFPLHTWLPDAMEGPTPVSALIHAATMVAAGVYLVARCFPFFVPEVLIVIAYIGLITLVLGATIALVMTDIKKILAYSTVSQLGYMMLAIGLGGWTAALLHLFTHAFFKALLFLGSGSVIHGCHHEQDIRKMGGLLRKMPITAVTMLVGVLAIIGTPLFSGWYSKDLVLGQAHGYAHEHPEHAVLFWLPMLTAVLTAYYMFRLWFLTFTGKPRDEHLYSHVHESPWVMTGPLILLALASVGIAWGSPIGEVEQSEALKILHHAEPQAVLTGFGTEHYAGHELHAQTGWIALGAATLGLLLAGYCFWWRAVDGSQLNREASGFSKVLTRKWYFDEIYRVLFVLPTVRLAYWIGGFDKRRVKPEDAEAADATIDIRSVDGMLNASGLLLYAVGQRLKQVQSGLVRSYLFVLVLTVVVLFAILSVFAS